MHQVIYEQMVDDTGRRCARCSPIAGSSSTNAACVSSRTSARYAPPARASAAADLPRRRGPVAALRVLAVPAPTGAGTVLDQLPGGAAREVAGLALKSVIFGKPPWGPDARRPAHYPQRPVRSKTAAGRSSGHRLPLRKPGRSPPTAPGFAGQTGAHPRHHHGDRAEAPGEPAKVPISLQVLGNTQLEQQNVAAFNDYAKLIPSLSFGTSGGGVFSGPRLRPAVHARRGQRQRRQPLGSQLARRVPGRAIRHHHHRRARHPHVRHRARGRWPARRAHGWRQLAVRHGAHHHPQTGSVGLFGRVVLRSRAARFGDGGIGHVLEGFVNVPINDHAADAHWSAGKLNMATIDSNPRHPHLPDLPASPSTTLAPRSRGFQRTDTVGVRRLYCFDTQHSSDQSPRPWIAQEE